MLSRIILVSVVVTSAQALPPQTAPTQETHQTQADLARGRVRLFEGVLVDAVNRGGQKLAEWTDAQQPGLQLIPAAPPVVQSIPLPDDSLLFTVQIGEILPSGVMIFEARRGERPVGTRVTSNSLPGSATVNLSNAGPNEAYSQFVHDSLVDAMLDSSDLLDIKPAQWLNVAAIPVDIAVTNPLYKTTSRKLILSVDGDTLRRYHQGTITKDEARLLVKEKRY